MRDRSWSQPVTTTMPYGKEHRRSTDTQVSSQRIFFRVLDLRVKRQISKGEHMRPYCVLRLGGLHHRTGSFSPDGLDQVSTRRTTADDRQLQACDNSNPGVWWYLPSSWVEQRCEDCSFSLHAEHRAAAEQAPGNQRNRRQYRRHHSGSCGHDSYMLLEIFNASLPKTGSSIDSFDAEMLGVLRIKLSDLWPLVGTARYRGSVGEREICDMESESDCTLSGGNLSEIDTTLTDATRDDWLYVNASASGSSGGVPVAQPEPEGSHLHHHRSDRWFGGVVSPLSSSPQRNKSPGANGTNASTFSVEARLEVRSACGDPRLTSLSHDDFGMAVDPRNVLKCSSAQGLWRLQQSSRRRRWKSEEGRKSWSSLLENCGSVDPVPGSVKHWGAHLRELIWSGVPTEMREEVYVSVSGAGWKRNRYGPGYYASLVTVTGCRHLEDISATNKGEINESGLLQGLDLSQQPSHCGRIKHDTCNEPPRERPIEHAAETFETKEAGEDHVRVWREIEADLDRVFINGRTRVNESAGVSALRRLLRAYSLHNPTVGYCQGMNFIAGLLLEVVSEETAFWLLGVFCEKLHPEYHTKSMLGARSDIAALKDLVRRVLPRLHARARDVGMPLEIKLTQWLIGGFVNCFPANTALRILEVSFFEGSDVYLATVLAFLRLHEVEILKGEDIAEVVCTLDLAQAGMYEADILLRQLLADADGNDGVLCTPGSSPYLSDESNRRQGSTPGKRSKRFSLLKGFHPPFAQVWREFVSWRGEIRLARQRHRIRITQEDGCVDRPGRGDCSTNHRSGWLQGRTSVESGGSAWLLVVPKSLAGHVQEILSSLSKRALTTKHDFDGNLAARPTLAPLMVGGIRWILGLKLFET